MYSTPRMKDRKFIFGLIEFVLGTTITNIAINISKQSTNCIVFVGNS